jgi:DnaK suppressor protein
MDAAARERFRRRLAELKAEILSEGDIEIEPARQDPTAITVDDDAQPLVEMSQAIASSRNRNRAQVLARVVAALGRLTESDDGAFGLCIECEEPIAAKRLDLMPYVELCVECQQAKDGPKGPTARRHLRDFK